MSLDLPAIGDLGPGWATKLNDALNDLDAAVEVDVHAYGALGDGSTDDTAEIQAAIDAAELITATGGRSAVVKFRANHVYMANAWTDSGTGWGYLWRIDGDRITIDVNGATIKSTVAPGGSIAAGVVFWPHGGGKVGDPGNYSTTWYPSRAMVNITGSHAKGATSITVSNGASFAAGDVIFIRTGQTLPITGTFQPDAEINEVLSVATNTLNLKYPLSKSYAPEYFISGTSGLTSTSVTANAAPYGIHKVTDCTIRDFTLRNAVFDTPLAGYWCLPMQVIGYDLNNLRGTFGICGTCVQYARSGRQRHYRAFKAHSQLDGTMVAGGATGSNDGLVDDVQVYGAYPTMFHLHEGTTDFTVSNCLMRTASVAGFTYSGGVSVRGRAYGTKILNNDIVGGTGNTVCVVDSSCVAGGLIQGNSFHAPAAVGDASITGKGWAFLDNEYVGLPSVSADNISERNRQRGITPVAGFTSRFTLGPTAPSLPAGATPTITAPFYQVGTGVDITNLLGGVDGEEITLIFAGARTLKEVATGGRFILSGAADFVATAYSTLRLRRFDSAAQNLWVETGRCLR